VVIDCNFPYIAKLCCSSFFWHFTFYLLQVFFSYVNFFVLTLRDVEGVSVLHGTKEACARKNRRGGAVFGVPGNLVFSTLHSALPFLEYL